MRGPQVGRQRVLVHREAVILAGDHDSPAVQVHHRMVGAVVPEFHLHRLRAAGQRQQLMSKADPERRQARVHQRANRLDRVLAGLGIPRPVGEKDPIDPQFQYLLRGRGSRQYADAATRIGQFSQDVAFDPVVVGRHMPGPGTFACPGLLRPETAFIPLVRHVGGDFLRQVHPLEPGKPPGRPDRQFRFNVGPGQNATALGALVANDPRELTRVDIGDRYRFAAPEVLLQTALGAPVADRHGEIAHDQAGSVDSRRFEVRGVGAGVTDVGIRQGDDLAKIGRVVKDLLIAGHGGVENHLADGLPGHAYGTAPENRPIFQRQYRRLLHL